jgi:hypothetical protein
MPLSRIAWRPQLLVQYDSLFAANDFETVDAHQDAIGVNFPSDDATRRWNDMRMLAVSECQFSGGRTD